VARDRKRARQRKVRQGRGAAADVREASPDATRAGVPAGTGGSTPAPASGSSDPSVPSGVPAALEHASGELEEFDAAMARGAAEAFSDTEETADAAGDRNGEAVEGRVPADTDLEGLIDETEGAAAGFEGAEGAPAAAFAQRDEQEVAERRPRRTRGSDDEHRLSLAARATGFLRASWAELQRMQWPDRQQTSQATAVVLGFVVVAGVYLGVADWVAQKIVNFVLG
jgi:preprotein translocase subunit SecE